MAAGVIGRLVGASGVRTSSRPILRALQVMLASEKRGPLALGANRQHLARLAVFLTLKTVLLKSLQAIFGCEHIFLVFFLNGLDFQQK